jgi:hypothetical protein
MQKFSSHEANARDSEDHEWFIMGLADYRQSRRNPGFSQHHNHHKITIIIVNHHIHHHQ